MIRDKLVTHVMRQTDTLRTGVQIFALGLLMGTYLWHLQGPLDLFIKLWAIAIFATLISTQVVMRVPLRGIINSVVINLLIGFLFFMMGNVFETYFRFEQELTNAIDINADHDRHDVRVVTASVVIFSGWEFFSLYAFCAVFAYTRFLKSVSENSSASVEPISQDRLMIKQGGKTHIVPYEEIVFVEASGNYLSVHTQHAKYAIRTSMQEWLSKANKPYLIRAHRSFIVNLQYIKKILSSADGLPIIHLNTGQKIKVGKLYKANVLESIGMNR